MPPSAAAIDATAAATRCPNTASASFAAGSVERVELVDARRLPESPSRPDSDSSARSISSTPSFPVRRRCSTISASIEPERVAIGTPSSGLKPIVVSTDRPSRTAVTEQPPPRWQTTSRSAAHLLGRPLHRQPVEPVAADAPLVAPARRQRVGRRLLRHRAVERRVEDRDVRDVRQRLHRVVDRGERLPLVERRQVGDLLERGPDLVVDDDRLAEARAAVHDAVRDRVDLPRPPSESTGRDASSPSTIESLRLVEPALTTRIELTRELGQVQSRISGSSSPCSRVYARARRRASSISCRMCAARSPSAGTRSITSMTRWKRSRSFSITMSNGVVVVPSSL